MVFTSYIFVFAFLPLVLVLHAACRTLQQRTNLLLIASYVFYAYWRADFALLLIISSVVNYYLGHAISAAKESPTKYRCLLVGVALNLLFLAYFKYLYFAVDNVNVLLDAMHLQKLDLPEILLPVGISFFTFHAISYLIDIYRGKVGPADCFTTFAAYMALFPQLVAGPIVRFSEVVEQFSRPLKGREYFVKGILLFIIGFNKKILIANNLAPIADRGFALADPSMLEAWMAVLTYSFQLYFDFSGYSDMAVGLGLMLGFNFPMNFDSPYRSQSIIEFWRRWHMTLSRFLRDYLYIPLGGNRAGRLMTSRNLFLVFLLGGLWHGAAWTFIVWGAYHGILLVIEHVSGRTAERKAGVSGLVRMLFTFLLVVIGWVFFRAESMGQALLILQAMAGLGEIHSVSGLLPYLQPAFWISFVMALLLVFHSVNSWQLSEQLSGAKKYLHLGLFLLALNEMFRQEFNPFLYFQF